MPQSDQIRILAYSFMAPVGGANQAPTPSNPLRQYLLIQNQGANPMFVTFGVKAEGNSNGLRIAGGAEREWYYRIPTEGINLTSGLGTNGVIWEGMAI